jgi:hypothetical protein
MSISKELSKSAEIKLILDMKNLYANIPTTENVQNCKWKTESDHKRM